MLSWGRYIGVLYRVLYWGVISGCYIGVLYSGYTGLYIEVVIKDLEHQLCPTLLSYKLGHALVDLRNM